MKKTIYTLLLTLGVLYSSAQTSKIDGKLISQKKNDLNLVIGKTKIILEQKGVKQTTIVNSDLSFSFDIQGFEEIRITPIPKGLGNTESYIYRFKNVKNIQNRGIDIEIPDSFTCKYDQSINNKNCSICKKQDKVIPIYFELIIDTEKIQTEYKAGACIISECEPNWYCKRDDSEF